MPNKTRSRVSAGYLAVGAIALFALGACSNLSDDANPTNNQVAQITDLPLPRGYDVNHGDTIVLGEGERMSGRLVYTINSSAPDMVDYFRREMPNSGWTELSVFRASTSVMTYMRGARVATIQVSPRTLFGAYVEMVIAPTTNGRPVASGSGTGTGTGALRPDDMQAPPSASGSAVSVRPLK
jgi:hypothetical protein